MKRVLAVLMACLMTLSFQVYASDASTESNSTDVSGKRIFFINVWRALDFFVNIEAAVKKEAEEYGVEVTCVDANLDYVATSDYMSQAVIGQYDCIMIDGDESLVPAANEAEAQGVPVINYDTYIGGKTSALVASDNKDMGRLDGEYAVELLKEKYDGEVKGIIYYLNFPVSSMQDRCAGFLEVFEEYPDVTLIEEVPNAEDVEVCQKLMDNVLIAAPEGNIDMIFASNSSSALGTIAAVESAARKDVIVIGIDDEEGQLNELKKSDSCYYATVAQDPIAIGTYCVEAAVKVMNGEEVEDIAVPAKLLTKENIEEYIAENESAKAELDAYK